MTILRAYDYPVVRAHPSPGRPGGFHRRDQIMCCKSKKKVKDKPGSYRCKSCGAVAKKKGKLCKPKKIK